MLLRLLSRRWLLATALVVAAAAVMVRLGIWQLDRLDQRRAFNARVTEQQEAPPLVLDHTALGLDLYSMEYRRVIVSGQFLPEDEIVLRNQVWSIEGANQIGMQLFTPLLIEGTDTAILIQRGWIPQQTADQQHRPMFAEPGLITVEGQLRRAETDITLGFHPDPTLASGETRLDTWNNLDLDRLADQTNADLLPVYIQQFPAATQTDPPFASVPTLELTEGSHMGYALQWFAFAAVLLIGYPFYVNRQDQALNA
jgi:surfeit locus 1 family protein